TDVQACELAFVEACNNAVRYATQAGRTRPIRAEISCGATHLQLRVEDHSGGFELPESIALPDPEQESGRGLFLIRAVMEKADYFRSAKGNWLVMEKARAHAATPATVGLQSMAEMTRQLSESEQIIRDMAEELSFCYESLSAIFRCSADLGRSYNLEEFCQRL